MKKLARRSPNQEKAITAKSNLKFQLRVKTKVKRNELHQSNLSKRKTRRKIRIPRRKLLNLTFNSLMIINQSMQTYKIHRPTSI
jgi:hypothetical protein